MKTNGHGKDKLKMANLMVMVTSKLKIKAIWKAILLMKNFKDSIKKFSNVKDKSSFKKTFLQTMDCFGPFQHNLIMMVISSNLVDTSKELIKKEEESR